MSLKMLAVLLPITGLALSTHDDAPTCSVRGTISLQSSSHYFAGFALSDTVVAGPGLVEVGYFDPALKPPRVYGQVFRPDLVSSALKEVLDTSGASEVVVVPWSYDTACRPTYWEGSSLWVSPRVYSFQSPRLRPKHLWVEGRPTFDLFFVQLNSYRDTGSAESLTAREYFALYAILPDEGETLRRDSAALNRVETWVSANPGLAAKPPANHMLAAVRRWYERRR